MKLQSLKKDYKLFTNIIVVVSIVISIITLITSYKSFYSNAKQLNKKTATNINEELNESLSYIENTSKLVGKQITSKTRVNKFFINKIFNDLAPKIDHDTQDIFTWTLFDFSDVSNYVIVASKRGILKKPVLITEEKRSWISESRIKPWRLIPSKTDIGLVSGEPIIPFGFGLTRKNRYGKEYYFGTLSMGINTRKLQRKLEKSLMQDFGCFILLGKDNSYILSSYNFDETFLRNNIKEINNLKSQDGFVKIAGQEFYVKYNAKYDMTILSGVDEKSFFAHFKKEFLPKLLNTAYLIIFFLILLYFFRSKLMKPFVKLSNIARDLSVGNEVKKIPDFDIEEAQLLANSLEKVKDLLEKEKEIKANLEDSRKLAETQNHNKTEFLSSTAHELKNILSGMVGLSELIKYNIEERNFDDKQKYLESISWIDDIIRLGQESNEFVNDLLDINQTIKGDFNINLVNDVDVKLNMIRAINLIKIKAIKEKKYIFSNISRDDSKKLFASDLDPRRIKQIFVNILSNAVKYSKKSQTINVFLDKLSEDKSQEINKKLLEELRNSDNLDQDDLARVINLVEKKIDNNDCRILIEISDEGIGMSEDEIKQATTKYNDLNHEFKKMNNIDSSGLGFSIVKYLIEAQGGILEVESKKGVGTKVRVIL